MITIVIIVKRIIIRIVVTLAIIIIIGLQGDRAEGLKRERYHKELLEGFMTC